MLNPILMSLALLGSPTPVNQTDPPIACQPKALDPVQRKRQKALLEIVRGKIQKTTELDNGFALQLPSNPETFLEVAEWVSLERRCCAFVEFALEWRLDDSVWVRLTGAPGVKEVLAAEMGIKAVGPRR